ncbi:hypothetical protein D918_00168 [Trichuris suis]|uniref:G-protein coupled receptors family 1 profile domain-containing protein n=1 Tax=Trichuris suis TaxID=68888 RepID=A0A085M8B7_9BILA|nr:hypothetical protein M513_05727 [Trichuris suis]KHJ49050.1 hypothetical protein D918_00168 [Trichuris suis]
MVYAFVLKIFLAFFGGIALVSNSALLVYTLLLKERHMFEKLVLIHVTGSAITGLGYLTSYTIKLSTSCHLHYSTPANCIARSPQIFCFVIGIPMESMGVLILVFDRFIATLNRSSWKFTNYHLVICMSTIASIVTCMAIALLLLCLYTKGTIISSCCYMETTAPKYYYELYYYLILSTGYANITVFTVTAIRYWHKRLHQLDSEHLQQSSGKYEAVCMKHTAIICLFGFMLQTIPSTISTYAYHNDTDSVIVPNMSAICIACYCAYPVYRFWTNPFCNRDNNSSVTFLNT